MTRLPDGWHRHFDESMMLSLNCPSMKGDANLGIHSELNEGGSSSEPEALPGFLYDRKATAALVEWVEKTAMANILRDVPDQSDSGKLIAAWDREFSRSAELATVRITSAQLRQVWSGCLAAAKAISPNNYWMGQVLPWHRYNLFRYAIFLEARANELYRRGALAAPEFKAFRKEPITFSGIPYRFHQNDFGEWFQ